MLEHVKVIHTSFLHLFVVVVFICISGRAQCVCLYVFYYTLENSGCSQTSVLHLIVEFAMRLKTLCQALCIFMHAYIKVYKGFSLMSTLCVYGVGNEMKRIAKTKIPIKHNNETGQKWHYHTLAMLQILIVPSCTIYTIKCTAIILQNTIVGCSVVQWFCFNSTNNNHHDDVLFQMPRNRMGRERARKKNMMIARKIKLPNWEFGWFFSVCARFSKPYF